MRPLSSRTLFLLAACVVAVNANCKSTDVKWKKNSAPTINQPNRSNPKQLKVSWDKIIENQRCVDEWNLYVWQDGTEKVRGQKMNIKSKDTLSKVVEVDPCVKYNFEIEAIEKDTFGTDKRSAKVATFVSSAVPKNARLDKSKFELTYHYDIIKKVHDLSKVTVKFDKSIIDNPSCVKHIEIIGIEVPRPPPTKTRGSFPSLSTSGSNRELAPGHSSGGSGSYGGGHGSYPGTAGGSGSYSGYPSSGSGSHSGGYPGSSSGFGSYPGTSGGGHSHGHDHGHSHSGSGQYPGYSGGWHSSSNSRSNSYSSSSSGSSGRTSYSDIAGRPGSRSGGLGAQDAWLSQATTPYPNQFGRKKRSLWGSKKTTKKPATTSRPSIGAAAMGKGKVLPPFRAQKIEINAPIKPCKAYKFTLKVVSPSGSVVSEVKDLVLPLMRDMDNYVPPPLAKMFKTTVKGNKAPVISLMPGYGVPAECLDDFFLAVDNRMYDLQADIGYHLRQEANAHSRGEHLDRQLMAAKKVQLKKQFGCVCDHNVILLNTTEAKTYKRYETAFGNYQFMGEQNGKPYYTRVPDVPAVGPPRFKRFIGNVNSNTTPRPSRSSAKAAKKVKKAEVQNTAQFFLYWDLKAKTWVVGPKMDGKKFVLKVKAKKNHEAKCPADPKTLKMWQYSGTLTWHDSELIRAACSLTH